MDEIEGYPIVQRLLLELFQLEPGDEQLPVGVLVNVHRKQLCAPFKAVVQLAETHPNEDPEEVLHDRYPQAKMQLLGGEALEQRWAEAHVDKSFDEIMVAGPKLSPAAMRLMKKAAGAWCNYDPAIALEHLTWQDDPLVAKVALLEEMLRMMPGSYEMLVDLAQGGLKH